ncbi:conjugal transfer protein [Bartonella machadoae]|uniref:conjugal transfer protein n=1 Tax=Bartonella machadoae TaxID=2893471 RepID=UPI001F4D2E7F|nr:conjugal transfer protein [Bartonella machadoae]UNE54087.1 conjugal transfer protein [Bartonella machadoae]
MKLLNILQAKINKRIQSLIITPIMFLIIQPVYAQTKEKSIDLFIGVQYGLGMFVPIIGAILFLLLLPIYLFRIISKATFVRWLFSIIVASAAFYISSLLFYIK